MSVLIREIDILPKVCKTRIVARYAELPSGAARVRYPPERDNRYRLFARGMPRLFLTRCLYGLATSVLLSREIFSTVSAATNDRHDIFIKS